MVLGIGNSLAASSGVSIDRMVYRGYPDCVRIQNQRTVVVICPAAGGRVLEYSLDGRNMMGLLPRDRGDLANENTGKEKSSNGQKRTMSAGRFDIGPEKRISRGQVLWSGQWETKILDDQSVQLTSGFDRLSGTRIVRTFQLAEKDSYLRCTQQIRNESHRTIDVCHWSRTFATGGGIAVVPKSPLRRFPLGVVEYAGGNTIKFCPDDPAIDVRENAVLVSNAPQNPKLGFDSYAGWIAYAAPNNCLFIKRYTADRGRHYNEVAGLTASVWYPSNINVVELEPIGPAEFLRPGESASFTESWYLREFPFPAKPSELDVDAMMETFGLTTDDTSTEEALDWPSKLPSEGSP